MTTCVSSDSSFNFQFPIQQTMNHPCERRFYIDDRRCRDELWYLHPILALLVLSVSQIQKYNVLHQLHLNSYPGPRLISQDIQETDKTENKARRSTHKEASLIFSTSQVGTCLYYSKGNYGLCHPRAEDAEGVDCG